MHDSAQIAAVEVHHASAAGFVLAQRNAEVSLGRIPGQRDAAEQIRNPAQDGQDILPGRSRQPWIHGAGNGLKVQAQRALAHAVRIVIEVIYDQKRRSHTLSPPIWPTPSCSTQSTVRPSNS